MAKERTKERKGAWEDPSPKPIQPQWDHETIPVEIRRLAKDGPAPSAEQMLRINARLYNAARRHFGSWEAAARAAGVSLPGAALPAEEASRPDLQHRHAKRSYTRWTAEKVLDGIREVKVAGSDLSPGDVRARNRPLYAAARKRFGSWEEAVKAAGLRVEPPQKRSSKREEEPPRAKRSYTRWTPESIVEEIRRLSDEGADLSKKGARTDHNSLFNAAWRYYGSWEAAMERAGFEVPPTKRAPRRRKG